MTHFDKAPFTILTVEMYVIDYPLMAETSNRKRIPEFHVPKPESVSISLGEDIEIEQLEIENEKLMIQIINLRKCVQNSV